MKKLLLTIAAIGLLSTLGVKAQGDFQYDNVIGTPSWQINDLADVPIAANATQYSYEAYWAAGGGVAIGLLQPTGLIGSGATWIGGGNFFYGTGTIPTASAGQLITLLIRAWDNTTGATYETATVRGQNPTTTNYTTPVIPNLPPTLDGLASFKLILVPEPSTLALAGLGAVALLAIRRRK